MAARAETEAGNIDKLVKFKQTGSDCFGYSGSFGGWLNERIRGLIKPAWQDAHQYQAEQQI